MARQLNITYLADRDMLGLVSDEDYEQFKDLLLEAMHKEWPKAVVAVDDGEHASVEVEFVNGDFPTAFVLAPAPGRLENVESTGFYFGATYNLTKDTSVTGMYGWAEADEIPGSAAACTAAGATPASCVTGFGLETHTSLHLNIIHKFWQRWQAGLEYRRFDVEAFNGTSGDVNLVHGALWFFF